MTEVEWVDAVDLSDRVVGVVSRPSLRDGGHNYRVAHVLLLDRAGRLLVQRPAGAKEFRYGSSVAGHVQAGETYVDAARREMREELGAEAHDLVHVGTAWLDEPGRRKFIGVFVGTANGPFHPDPLEVAGLEWLSLEDVRARLRAAAHDFSETFRRVFVLAEESGAFDRA